MAAHASKGASGAKRWMACPGSLAMSEGRPNSSGEAAMEGTAAHYLGETCLKSGENADAYLGQSIMLDQAEDCFFFTCLPHEVVGASRKACFEVNANMVDAVQIYLNAVRDEIDRMGPDAELGVEKRFDLTWLRPDMFGTNDASLLLLFEELVVFDYKHGQGVGVEVADWAPTYDAVTGEPVYDVVTGGPAVVLKGNPQLLYYALGAANDCGWAFEKVTIVVVQPRKAHVDGPVRRWSCNKADLLIFAGQLGEASDRVDEATLKFEKVSDADEMRDWEALYLKAGPHCQFCPAGGIPCPELREECYRQAGIEFAEDGSVSSQPVDEGSTEAALELAMTAVPMLDVFIKAVETEALRRLRESTDGTGFGHKLVRKRAIRKWAADAPLVADALVAKGFPRDALFQEPKMLSPTQVEGLRPTELMASLKAAKVKAPAQAIKAIVAEFAFKPEGGLTIAPASDPRDAVPPANAAADDFSAVEDDFY